MPIPAHAAPARGTRLDAERAAGQLDRLFRAAMALTGNPHDADDLVQELFENLLRRPREMRGDCEVGYLLTALRHRHIDNRRARARRPAQVELEFERSGLEGRSGERPHERLEQREVLDVVAGLREHHRDVLVLVDVAGLSYDEAATTLGIPAGTVMSRLYRAREQVARAFEPACCA